MIKIRNTILHRTHCNNANKLLAFLSVPRGTEIVAMRWSWVRDMQFIVLHSETVMVYSTKPTLKFHMLFGIFLQSFKVGDKCPNEILPNDRANCEVRWRRDGLSPARGTGT